MKKMIGLLLLASLATAQEAQSLNVALEAATVGSVILLPEAKPAGWAVYAVTMGEKTPGHERWASPGRVVLAYRANESRRVLAVKVQGNDLWFWAAGQLEGKGWSISDRLPQPAVVVAVEPARSASFEALVEQARVEEVIALPVAKPAGWTEIKLHQSAASYWRTGVVGALICEADATRLPFVVTKLVGEGEQVIALAWMRDSDVAQLGGRRWREVRRQEAEVASPALTPPPLVQNGAASVKETPVVMPPNVAKSPLPGLTPPSPGLARPNWLTDLTALEQLGIGAKVSAAGLDPYNPASGWKLGLQVSPPAEWQPGLVVVTPHGLAVVIGCQEAAGPTGRATASYWYRPQVMAAIGLPEPTALVNYSVGTKLALPADTDWAKNPAGWTKTDIGPLTDVQRRRLVPGLVSELTAPGQTAIRVVVLATVYDKEKPEQWFALLWAAAKPDDRVSWKLSLP
jgi:hypothetical protein